MGSFEVSGKLQDVQSRAVFPIPSDVFPSMLWPGRVGRCGAHGRAGHHEAPRYELLAQQHAEPAQIAPVITVIQ